MSRGFLLALALVAGCGASAMHTSRLARLSPTLRPSPLRPRALPLLTGAPRADPAAEGGATQTPIRELFTPGFEAPLGEQVDSAALNAGLNIAVFAAIVVAVIFKVVTVDADISRGWTFFEILSRVGEDNWSDYTSFLTSSPVLTKAITSGAVYAIGDVLAQTTEGKGPAELDRVRIVRSAGCGFTLHGPLSHLWYIFAEGVFETLGWGEWYFVPLKIMMDQVRSRPAPPSPRPRRATLTRSRFPCPNVRS